MRASIPLRGVLTAVTLTAAVLVPSVVRAQTPEPPPAVELGATLSGYLGIGEIVHPSSSVGVRLSNRLSAVWATQLGVRVATLSPSYGVYAIRVRYLPTRGAGRWYVFAGTMGSLHFPKEETFIGTNREVVHYTPRAWRPPIFPNLGVGRRIRSRGNKTVMLEAEMGTTPGGGLAFGGVLELGFGVHR